MSAEITVREACRRRMPLDGADAQALEGALSQCERELACLRAQLERLLDASAEGSWQARALDAEARVKQLERVAKAAKAFRDWDAIGALVTDDETASEDAQNDLRELDEALAGLR